MLKVYMGAKYGLDKSTEAKIPEELLSTEVPLWAPKLSELQSGAVFKGG